MRKISTIKSLCLLAVFVVAGFGAKAQYSHLETSFFIPSFNIPVGDFGKSVDNIPMYKTNMGKAAGFGFGAGARIAYRFDIGFGEVSPFAGVEFFWNRVKSDLRDAYDAGDYSKPFYVNVPVFFGVGYRYEITDIFTPFAEFGLGPDFLFIHKESSVLGDFKYKTTTSLAWEVGVGTYFNKRFSLGIHYYSFGSHKIKYKKDYAVLDNGDNIKRNLGSLMFRIGFHF